MKDLRLDMGRSGSCKIKGRSAVLDLEVSKFAGNKPHVYKASVFVDKTGKLDFATDKKIPIDKTSLSNSGNGTYYFNLDLNNLDIFQVSEILYSGSRIFTEYVAVNGDEVKILDTAEDVAEFLNLDFTAEIGLKTLEQKAKVEKAKDIIKEIHSEILALREDAISSGVEAEFKEPPTESTVLSEMVKEGFSKNEYIFNQSNPSYYFVTEPFFIKNMDKDELLKIAAEKLEEASRLKDTAEEIKKTLPKLKGTPRQVSWATEIRAKAYESNKENPRLQSEKEAKFWIESRHNF